MYTGGELVLPAFYFAICLSSATCSELSLTFPQVRESSDGKKKLRFDNRFGHREESEIIHA